VAGHVIPSRGGADDVGRAQGERSIADAALVADQPVDPDDQDGWTVGTHARRRAEVMLTRGMLVGILERISQLRLAPG
jgi:hypothetical protein